MVALNPGAQTSCSGSWHASNIAKLPTLLGKVLPDDAANNLSGERHSAGDTTPE